MNNRDVIFRDKIIIENYKEKKQNKGLFDFLRIEFIASGLLTLLYFLLDLSMTQIAVYSAIIILVALSVAISHVKKQKIADVVVHIPVGAALIVFLILGPASFARGVLNVIDILLMRFNLRFETNISLISVSGISKQDMFLFGAVVLLVVLWLVSNCVYKERNRAIVAVIAVIALVSVTLSISVAVVFFFLSMASWSEWIHNQYRGSYNRKLIWIAIMGATLLVLLVLCNNIQVNKVNSFRNSVYTTYERARFGSDTLPEGNLKKADKLNQGEEPTLTVNTELAKSQYFIGFVGGQYSNGRWKPLQSDKYASEYSGLIKWLKNRDFIPQQQSGTYLDVDGTDIPSNEIEIVNEGANRKYIYMPYSAMVKDTSGMKQKQDSNYQSSRLLGSKEYKYEEYSTGIPPEIFNTTDWITDPKNQEQEEYLETEAAYRNFVYDKYLEVDDNCKDICNRIFWKGVKKSDKEGIYSSVKHIRKVFEENYSVIESKDTLANTESGRDPLQAFLISSKEGNAPYFASAAVMALRTNGIPARYTEGYVMTEVQAKGADNTGKVTLTDKDAHAWVEIYMDAIGWVPIDVTPGHYMDTYALMEMLKTPDKLIKTAALEEESEKKSDNVLDDSDEGPYGKERRDSVKDALNRILGILVILLVLIMIFVVIMELRRVAITYNNKRNFVRASNNEKVKMACTEIDRLFGIMGISANLGWKAEKIENALIEKAPVFEKGDYLRINELAEKMYFGGIEPEPAEILTFEAFVDKLYYTACSMDRKTRIKTKFYID